MTPCHVCSSNKGGIQCFANIEFCTGCRPWDNFFFFLLFCLKLYLMFFLWTEYETVWVVSLVCFGLSSCTFSFYRAEASCFSLITKIKSTTIPNPPPPPPLHMTYKIEAAAYGYSLWFVCVGIYNWSPSTTLSRVSMSLGIGWRGESVCLTGCWKGAGRGAGSCLPARYCEGAVPKQSTHLLSAGSASFCSPLCLKTLIHCYYYVL